MNIQSNPQRRSFFSIPMNSTLRLALIAPIVFGVAVIVGYPATAKAPTLLKRMVGSAATQPPLIKPIPSHPMSRLLHVASAIEPVVYTDKPNYQPGETAVITGSGFWP